MRNHSLIMAGRTIAAAAGRGESSWLDAGAIFVVGVVVIVAFVALLGRRRGRAWGVAWGMRPGRLGGVQKAAAADVAAMQEEDETYFRPDGPGHHGDDL